MLTVRHAQLNFNPTAAPYSDEYSDCYFSQAGAIEECRHVFIQGNGLHQRWQNNDFSIAELGFGCGINFLTTCTDWLQHADQSTRLHYISFEKHPVQPAQLQKIYQTMAVDQRLATDLLNQYPLALQGFHRLQLAEQRITLTLIFGDALSQLKQCDFEADAWYLDGFAPSKNPALWSQAIADEVYRLTTPGGTLATYSVAAKVKQHFQTAGFELHKQAGFADKKHMLTGVCHKPDKPQHFHYTQKSWLQPAAVKTATKEVVIIGGGMAGFCLAGALAERGWQCTIVDREPAPAMAGSGNQNAILMPRLSVDHDIQSQLTLQGFLFSRQFFNALDAQQNAPLWHACGAIQIARDAMQAQRMQHIVAQENIPAELIQVIDQQQASALSHCQLSAGGWYIPLAGWIVPKQLCLALQAQYPEQIKFIGREKVTALQSHARGWQVITDNRTLPITQHVILANANAVTEFEQSQWCRLHAKRGQLTHIPCAQSNVHPRKIICSDVYLTPAVDQQYVLGASFISADNSTRLREREHRENLTRLKKIIPTMNTSSAGVGGRAAVRAVGPDRLPVLGPIAKEQQFQRDFQAASEGNTRVQYPRPDYYPGLYIASGFGSRGLAWIPLCAEALACVMNDEPAPLSRSILQALHPSRILMKQLIGLQKK